VWLPAAGAQTYGLDSRAPIGAFLDQRLPSADQSSLGWQVVEAFPNVTLNDPVSVVPEPGTDRLMVCERQGTIQSFTNNASASSKQLFLDLTAVTQGYDDCGLLGMAFHPEYGVPGSTNRGYFYIFYQYSPDPVDGPSRPPSETPGYNRLSRFTVPDGSLVADRNSELVLINQFDRHVWHNGGALFFGPDGFLYLSNGDEGGANDQYNQTQKLNAGLFSGVLRIDVDMDPTRSHPIRRQPVNGGSLPSGWTLGSFSAHYYIPNDNPWQDPGGGTLEEFWAIGLRSPHRMTLDPPTGRIWLGDVGQGSWEEVSIIERGGNYQWPYREGDHSGPKSKPNPLIGVDRPPVHDYGRTEGNCVIGGFVYRGSEHAAALYGKYIFGDNGSGRIWALTYDGINPVTVTYLCNMPAGANYTGLSGFGVDHDQEMYLCKMGRPSKIYKLARTGVGPPPPPSLLSQVGAFADLEDLTPAPGLVPFAVNSPLWSDGAVKQRWIAVPNNGAPYGTGESVGFSPTGEWSFPVGTVFVKHFELPIDETQPELRQRLETRFLVQATNGTVYGLTYKWRADGSDADLLAGSLTEQIAIQTASGVRTQTWYYPSRQDCLSCHTGNAGYVLGVRTCQLNGDFSYPETGRTDNQLRAWNHVGLFNPPINESAIPTFNRTVPVDDPSAALEHRVRSYLDANCAQCHRPNGVQGYFDARFDTPLASQGIVDGAVVNSLGIVGARVIAPQNLDRSVLHLRVGSLDQLKMPPLAKNELDPDALDAIRDWVASLPLPVGVPPPWDDQDIGSVGVAGSATYSLGTFTVTGSGADIWDTADAFRFVHQPVSGDLQLVARVVSLQNTDPWAKAGVMIRETLAAGSRHAFMAITPGNGAAFQRRTSTGGTSTHTAGAAVAAPYWVRLVRSGSTLTGYQSSDGINWQVVGSASIAMSSSVRVGLAVTSHNNSLLATATFQNVLLTGPNINNPPTISSIANQTIPMNDSVGPLLFTVGDVETPASALTVTAESSSPTLIPPGNVSLGGTSANRTVTVTPEPNQTGSSFITLTVSDGALVSAISFRITVELVNQPPVTGPDLAVGPPDIGLRLATSALLANDSDPDADPVTIQSVDSATSAGGVASLAGGWVYYTPPPGFSGEDVLVYHAADPWGASSPGAVTIDVAEDPAPTENQIVEDLGDGTIRLRFFGIPGRVYRIQYTEDLEDPVWQTLTSQNAGSLGWFEHTDHPPAGATRHYRAVNP
jgi:uncharacterized repeat protein (TIGR03806 family)